MDQMDIQYITDEEAVLMNSYNRSFMDKMYNRSFQNKYCFNQSVYPIYGNTIVYDRCAMDKQNHSDGNGFTEINPANINIRLNPDIVGIDIVEKNRTAKYGKRDRCYEDLFTSFNATFIEENWLYEPEIFEIMMLLEKLAKKIKNRFSEHLCLSYDFSSIIDKHDITVGHLVKKNFEYLDEDRDYKNYNRGLPARAQMFHSARNAI